MANHNLLQKQIDKYLSPERLKDKEIKNFIKAINKSYISFEKDKELMNHAFNQSEIEYLKMNESLKNEFELKKLSISNLLQSLEVLEDDFQEITANHSNDDLLYISKYLNQQIEKKKEVENNLLTTVELLKRLIENLQSGVLVEDENRKILFTNQMFCDMFYLPISPEELKGTDCTNSSEQSKHLFKNPEEFCSIILTILKNKKITTNELIETVDNRYLERDYIPISINNEYKGHLWKYTDVTERINTNKLLEQSEERNRLIMNSSLNAIINIDTIGRITFWNDRAEALFGWKKTEILGKKLTQTIIPKRYRSNHDNGMKHYLNTGDGPVLNKLIELSGVQKNGLEFPIEISIIPIKQNDELFFCSFIQDISERKVAENNLKLQEEKYRNIIANMNLGLVEFDTKDTIQFANQSFAEMSGYKIEELKGKKPEEIFDLDKNINIINKVKKLSKDLISNSYQIPIKNKNGEEKWWAISGAANYDDKGKLVGNIGIYLDITEQKQLEIDLNTQKNKAQEASKSKETFLANMSHEIRTPLNAIVGFLRELKKQDLTDLQKKYIENSAVASKHLLAIINNVLDISKIEAREMSLEKEDFVLENSINNIVNVLIPKANEKGIGLKAIFDPKISCFLKGDVLRIEQILFNLIGNAIKFTLKGKIEVICSLIKEDENAQDICLTIVDTGIGMDKKFMNSIFKKFSQEDIEVTRKYGGTGLGMAITKELVNLMEGDIKIESEKNVGTTIKIYLTFLKGNESQLKNNNSENKTKSLHNISILLVEDNLMNRVVAQNSLQYYNCKVTEAENGLEALEILKKENFDIILMDIQMPELDGIETTKIIRKEFKLNTPIIALTANAFKSEIDKCKKAGMNDYVTKPFEEINLIETIAKYTSTTNPSNKKIEKKSNKNKKILYNLNSLQNLSRGNQDFVKKMLALFINETKTTINKVDVAIAKNNFIEVSQLIHKIKPSIEGVGISSLKDNIIYLEKISKESKNRNEICVYYYGIKDILLQAVEQIKENEL